MEVGGEGKGQEDLKKKSTLYMFSERPSETYK